MKATAIFGGIGGFELGMAKAGHSVSTFCELDVEARTVLRGRFPDAMLVPDITRTAEVIASIDPKSDLLTAGFPCTDLSQAGLTRGFSGGRSSLIRDVVRLLNQRPFSRLLIENVPNWRTLHRGAYLAEVIEDLERLGYRWAYRTIDALAFGVPQRRKRIFLIASLEEQPCLSLFAGSFSPPETRFGLSEAAHGFYWTEGNTGLGWGENCVPTLKGGSSIGIPALPAILRTNGEVITPDVRDAERLQGFPSSWTDFDEIHPDVGCGRFNSRKRILLIGNAVNVNVSAWLGKAIATPCSETNFDSEILGETDKWPEAAWFDGRQRRAAHVTAWPVVRKRQGLEQFLKFRGAPLSERATKGFYKRISASRLRFQPGFKDAIAAHLGQYAAESDSLLEVA